MSIIIREATIEDSSLILKFVKELAKFEKAASEVSATIKDIQRSIFSTTSTVYALICCINEEPIGFAVYFYNYSTWKGKNGLFLEDIYISPKYRSKSAGKMLLKHLAKIAVSQDCSRFELSVLDWNKSAIKFYESIGAKPQSEWINYRLEGKDLEEFANK
ncbi:MAG: GNAT family N-acetyltransferase [Candidatus Cloacimonetes bacterium]|jgi:ribosomal protein S18 acetylase RimI-like enzyme|nr:GNAT family N-acetyltransferase [Candidatus Cloacimonadota bacterium]